MECITVVGDTSSTDSIARRATVVSGCTSYHEEIVAPGSSFGMAPVPVVPGVERERSAATRRLPSSAALLLALPLLLVILGEGLAADPATIGALSGVERPPDGAEYLVGQAQPDQQQQQQQQQDECQMLQVQVAHVPQAERPGSSSLTGSEPEFLQENDTSRRSRPMIWVHLQKAAGSFMCRMAVRAAESVVHPNDNCDWYEHDGVTEVMKRSSSMDCERRWQIWKEAGWSWGALERELRPEDKCWDQFDYGVSLREPIDMMDSVVNYQYTLNRGPHGQPKDVLLAQLKEKIASHAADDPALPEWKFFDNIQTRLLTDSMAVPAGRITQEHVDRALEVISHFAVVTRVEDLQEQATRKAVFKKLGWSHDEVYEQASAADQDSNHIKEDPFVFTEEEKEWLRELNKWDLLLYRSISPIRAETESA